jgi:hypothetical protein
MEIVVRKIFASLNSQTRVVKITVSPVAGSSNRVVNETPSGAIDNANAIFQTLNSFAVNTLEVFLNGLKLKEIEDYTVLNSTQFQLNASPTLNEVITVNYNRNV